jgi:hypothetical protein
MPDLDPPDAYRLARDGKPIATVFTTEDADRLARLNGPGEYTLTALWRKTTADRPYTSRVWGTLRLPGPARA